MKYIFYIILIFFNLVDSVIIPLQLSNPDHQGGSFISSVIEPAIIGYSMSETSKSHFYVIYALLYLQLIIIIIPAMILSFGLFMYIWKHQVDNWVRFFMNKMAEGSIKE